MFGVQNSTTGYWRGAWVGKTAGHPYQHFLISLSPTHWLPEAVLGKPKPECHKASYKASGHSSPVSAMAGNLARPFPTGSRGSLIPQT